MNRTLLRLRSSLPIVAVIPAISGFLVGPVTAQMSPEPPSAYGPVSINMEEVDYPFEVKYLPLVMYGQDARLAYMDELPTSEPNGRTVVMLHGMNFFAAYWGETMEVLRDNGFRVIAIDQIGFGRSSKPIVPYTLGDMALNIRTLLEHLGVSRVAIVGHSMGGMVATRFAFYFPESTSHLVLVNQIGLTDTRLSRPPQRIEQSYESGLGRDYQAIRANIERYYVNWDPAAEEFVRIHYGWTLSSDWPRLAMIRALLAQMIYQEPVIYDWPHIQPKTLVLAGAEDGPNFPELASRAVAAIPDAEMHLIPEVGHNPHLEAPELFRPVLIDFLVSDP